MKRNRDSAQYSTCSGIRGLEILTATWVEHRFAPHMHDFHAISLNDAGRGAFDCRRETHDAVPGSCNLIAPGELHTGRPTTASGWTYRNLHIDSQLMGTLLESIEWCWQTRVSFKAPLVSDPVLSRRLLGVFAGIAEAAPLLQQESRLMSVVARLATHHFVRSHPLAGAGREHVAVRTVKEWLDANFRENVSIRTLARHAQLSPYYLVRAFHREVGVPPHRYQMIVRITHARQLIGAGVSLADAADQAGFCDQSHLTRCFKRALGVAPGQYSRSLQRSGDVADHVQ